MRSAVNTTKPVALDKTAESFWLSCEYYTPVSGKSRTFKFALGCGRDPTFLPASAVLCVVSFSYDSADHEYRLERDQWHDVQTNLRRFRHKLQVLESCNQRVSAQRSGRKRKFLGTGRQTKRRQPCRQTVRERLRDNPTSLVGIKYTPPRSRKMSASIVRKFPRTIAKYSCPDTLRCAQVVQNVHHDTLFPLHPSLFPSQLRVSAGDRIDCYFLADGVGHWYQGTVVTAAKRTKNWYRVRFEDEKDSEFVALPQARAGNKRFECPCRACICVPIYVCVHAQACRDRL